jgi:ribosome-dependent ATPase
MTDAIVARLDGVSHRYGATVALDDVTIEVPARKMVGVIGPDGVGKSTMLALISSVRTVQSGKVIVFDGDVTKRSHLKGLRARAARSGPQSLSYTQRIREYRFLRPAVRAIGP